jgi:Mg2+ and Co2+ transporter CorA
VLRCFAISRLKVLSRRRQKLALPLADTLLKAPTQRVSIMSDQKMRIEDEILRSSAAKSQLDPATGQTGNVIVLHDLTNSPEAEIGRLKTRLIDLTRDIGELRNENQSLKAQLRDVKQVLSKVQIDELRGIEKASSWLRSLKKDL